MGTTAQPQIRVLSVDDHALLRQGLKALLDCEADMTVVAQAGDGEEAVSEFKRHLPDITLMDMRLPKVSGPQAIRAIRSQYPSARILALTMYVGDEDIHQALEAGACGYLLKDMLRLELVDAIRRAHRGLRVIPPAVALQLRRYTRAGLTPRESEILRHVCLGCRNREIAKQLGILEGTVKSHVKSILGKLNAEDRTQAATTALERGIIHLSRTLAHP